MQLVFDIILQQSKYMSVYALSAEEDFYRLLSDDFLKTTGCVRWIISCFFYALVGRFKNITRLTRVYKRKLFQRAA